jgi:outer membrane autotransporter protein
MSVGNLVRARARGLRNSVAAVCVAAAVTASVGVTPARASDLFLQCIGACLSGEHPQTVWIAARLVEQGVFVNLSDAIDYVELGAPLGLPPIGYAAIDADDLDPGVLGFSAKNKKKRSAGQDAFAAARPRRYASPTRTNVTYAAWAQGFYEREERSGRFLNTDIGRTTRTSGGIFGVDAVIMGVRHMSDAVVIGVLGGVTESRVRDNVGSSSRLEGESFGVYGAYVDGPWSLDGVVKADMFDLYRTTAAGAADTTLGLTNYSLAMNLNYKIQKTGWWLEPTAGFSWSRLYWNDTASRLGFEDGEEFRIQGGFRSGTSWTTRGVQIEPSFGVIAYVPVVIDGGSIASAGTPSAPTDQGKLFGLFNGKLNVIWSKYLSTYVEGEVRVGSNDSEAYGGRVGGRWTFNPT